MSARALAAVVGTAALLLGLPAAAMAQARPSEEELFGASAAPPSSSPTPAPAPKPGTVAPADGQDATPRAGEGPAAAPPGGEAARDAQVLSGAGLSAADHQVTRERDDMLKVGGVAYLRAVVSWDQSMGVGDGTLVTPQLLDVYLDARPNDRVRAFTLGRLIYTPSGGVTGYDLTLTPINSNGPTTRATLDQLWINFDVDRTVFVTAGKQHVKWGTGRFWTPTDYLHPVRRDPLTQFDARTGTTLVKAQLPWEQRGWNLYGIALLEDISGGTMADGSTRTVSTLGQVGLGGRAEVVLGPAELAIDFMEQRGHEPRAGLDGSFPLGEVDVHFEVGLRKGRDIARWEVVPGTTEATPWVDRYQPKAIGFAPAAVVGAEWSWKYSDQDVLTLGAEYDYDASGYTSPSIYPFLAVAPQAPTVAGTDARLAFTPFYLARQYAGLYAYLPAPGSWNDTTFTLSLLASLTDGSAVLRLDHSVVINTYLRVETYVAGHLGREGGEFRLGFTVPPQPPYTTAPYVVPPPVVDVGLALRVTM